MRFAIQLPTAALILFNLCIAPISANEIILEGNHSILDGPFARLQLVVTSQNHSKDQQADITRKVKYTVVPTGLLQINAHGRVTPLADGTATVTAQSSNGQQVKTSLTVKNMNSNSPQFHRDIMPILSKYECNSCHGKPKGQNGFRLSLFGYDPPTDYETIVKESRGRRIFPAVAEQSLLLLKATGGVPHGGGNRIARNTVAYNTMQAWISTEVPAGNPDDAVVDRIELSPLERRYKSGDNQQLRVIAYYRNGSIADVSHMAIYHTNDPMIATVEEDGLVTVLEESGNFVIVVKYGGQVGAFRGTVPYGSTLASIPKSRNFIDEAVFAQLKSLGIPPSPACDDATFLRRVTIDITGRLPTLEETNEFVDNNKPSVSGSVENDSKREALIERLLASPQYADYFANKWVHILRNRRLRNEYRRGSYTFQHWIRQHIHENKPYDEFVRSIVAATGEMSQHPPATWYRDLLEAPEEAENMAQLFLGVRITCARCHHHPYEKWSQRDYYQLTAFFSQVDRKPSLNGYFRSYEKRIFHRRGLATAKHPVTGETLKPTPLGGESYEIDPDSDPRQRLVDWMTESSNPFFATVLVNRYWKHFSGRGIVEPEDDLRDTNPPSNPELLTALRQHFIDSGYDLKHLVRTICNSRTYQLASSANDINLTDVRNYSRYYPKRLNAEVLQDAMDDLLATNTKFSSMPPDMRAVRLPDTGSDNQFLQLFGKPKAETSCECERVQDGDLRQSLYMFISSEVTGKLSISTGRVTTMAKDKTVSDKEKIHELYMRAFCRAPNDNELKIALAHLKKNDSNQKSYADLLWVLINTKEFMYNK